MERYGTKKEFKKKRLYQSLFHFPYSGDDKFIYGVVIVSYMIGENLNTIGKSRKPERKKPSEINRNI